MSSFVTLLLLIPLLTALCTLALRRAPRLQMGCSLGGSLALAVAAVWLVALVVTDGIQVTQAGDWPAPFGITLAADHLGALMILLAAASGLAVNLHSLVGMGTDQEGSGYHPMFHLMLMGVCGSFLAGDAFNLYVWFEVMLAASFILLTAGNGRPQLEGGIKYFALNFLASTLLLCGAGLLYGTAGTLNFADLASFPPEARGSLILPAVLLIASFAIKSALFPFCFWLPASYHTPPPAVSALFASLLTKVGAYALIRLFTLVFFQHAPTFRTLFLVLAGVTMLAGALGAVAQQEIRRLFSFLVISHMGYLLLGLGLFSRLGLAGTTVFVIHLVLVNASLYLNAGMIEHESGAYRLPELGGLFRAAPRLTFLFLVPALSLTEIPPFPGFWGKLLLLRAALEEGYYLLAGIMLLANLLTVYAVVKIWNEAFWKNRPREQETRPPERIYASKWSEYAYYAPVCVLALILLLLGLFVDPMTKYALATSVELLDPSRYISAVLSGGAP